MSLSIMLAFGLAVGTANPKPTPSTPVTPVVSRTAPADKQLTKAIVAKLTGYKNAGKLRDFDLSIDVEAGTVWLQGSVTSTVQRDLVRRSVKSVPNVRTVIDNLRVQSGPAIAKRQARRVSEPTATVRPVKRPRRSESASPPQPTPAKKDAQGHHQSEHNEHHHEGEVSYTENWSPDGCECCGNGKLPCAFKSTCDMLLRHPYSAQPAFYYYFRPYQWTHISLQQQEAARYGVSSANPYDNRFFEAVYKEVEGKVGMRREEVKSFVRTVPSRTFRRSGVLQRVSKQLVFPKTPVGQVKSAVKPVMKPLDLGKVDDEPIYRKKRKSGVNARSVNYLAPKKLTLKKK